MRYYAQYNDDTLIAIGTGLGGVEITKEEYDHLLAKIREKASLVEQLYNDEITIDFVKPEWQEEIQRRVDERKAWESEYELSAEATEEDYIAALLELGVEADEED